MVKQISTFEHLKQFEIDEREHSELKKSKGQSLAELVLVADLRAANRSKTAEEGLKRTRKIAADRRNILLHAHQVKLRGVLR